MLRQHDFKIRVEPSVYVLLFSPLRKFRAVLFSCATICRLYVATTNTPTALAMFRANSACQGAGFIYLTRLGGLHHRYDLVA
jgi:hypothetical protein